MTGNSIIVVTRNLPPLVGGMERLVWHMVASLASSRTVHVIGPEGCSIHLPDGVTATEVPLAPLSRFLVAAQRAAWRAARRTRPEWILAGSGLLAPAAWFAARTAGAKAGVYLHGLDIEVRHPLYRFLWRPLFRHFDQVLVNSRFTRGLAEDAGVPPRKISILHPGVEMPDLSERERKRSDFRERYSLGNAPTMLHVGRITARKGLEYFVTRCLPAVVEQVPEAKLVVIGGEPDNALAHRAGELERVKQALVLSGLEEQVLFLSDVPDEVLDAAYFAADVLVFPVQAHPTDHEGFGMVALEAAAHGLPTVAFAAGGVPDAVCDPGCGRLVQPGDDGRFVQGIVGCLKGEDAIPGCIDFARELEWPRFGRRLERILA